MREDEPSAALTVWIAAIIGASAVVLAVVALQSDHYRELTRTVPPAAKCFVSGLLSGLGLLVMLPSALEERPHDLPLERVLLIFCTAPLVMFFLHHIILEHQHNQYNEHSRHPVGESCICEAPGKFCFFEQPKICPQVICPQVGYLPGPRATYQVQTVFSKQCLVVFRALPYTLHATIDGALLGAAQSPMMLAALVLPITLCTIQDVGVILVNQGANSASHLAVFTTVLCFAIGFPIGATLVVALTTASFSASAAHREWADVILSSLRAFAGGLFLYMSLFELAPSHVHGRLPNLRYLFCFAVGLFVAYTSEAVEAAVTHVFAVDSLPAVDQPLFGGGSNATSGVFRGITLDIGSGQ